MKEECESLKNCIEKGGTKADKDQLCQKIAIKFREYSQPEKFLQETIANQLDIQIAGCDTSPVSSADPFLNYGALFHPIEKTPIRSMRNIAIQSDKALLDGVEIMTQSPSTPPEKQKWIIALNGNNAVVSSDSNAEHALYARRTHTNFLSCDYRGVGNSTGFPSSEKDLITDAESMVEYLKKKGVPPENILLYGRSLGGGIAAQTAAKKGVHLATAMSFSSLQKTVPLLVRNAAMKTTVAFLGVLLSYLLSSFVGYVAGKLLPSKDWSLNSSSVLQDIRKKGRQVAVLNARYGDNIIPHEASLRAAVKANQAEKSIALFTTHDDPQILREQHDFAEIHNDPLSKHPEVEAAFLKEIRHMLQIDD